MQDGTALDARVGIMISRRCDHALEVSLELTPSCYDSGRRTGLALLVGYHHL